MAFKITCNVQMHFCGLQGSTLSHSLLLCLHLRTLFTSSFYLYWTIWSHKDLSTASSFSSQSVSIYLLHFLLETLVSKVFRWLVPDLFRKISTKKVISSEIPPWTPNQLKNHQTTPLIDLVSSSLIHNTYIVYIPTCLIFLFSTKDVNVLSCTSL